MNCLDKNKHMKPIFGPKNQSQTNPKQNVNTNNNNSNSQISL